MAEAVRRNVTDWVMGIILALLLFLGSSEAFRLYRLNTIHMTPAEAYFEPMQLNVPDFKAGGNPILFYDRTIHQEFKAEWIVEAQLIQSTGKPISVCTGVGENIFMPEKGLPAGGATLDWFMGTNCNLGPGTYRLVANWEIERPAATGNVTTRLISNLFEVES